jgi:hypothetical protein
MFFAILTHKTGQVKGKGGLPLNGVKLSSFCLKRDPASRKSEPLASGDAASNRSKSGFGEAQVNLFLHQSSYVTLKPWTTFSRLFASVDNPTAAPDISSDDEKLSFVTPEI